MLKPQDGCIFFSPMLPLFVEEQCFIEKLRGKPYTLWKRRFGSKIMLFCPFLAILDCLLLAPSNAIQINLRFPPRESPSSTVCRWKFKSLIPNGSRGKLIYFLLWIFRIERTGRSLGWEKKDKICFLKVWPAQSWSKLTEWFILGYFTQWWREIQLSGF